MVRVQEKLKVPKLETDNRNSDPYHANDAFVFNKSIELVVINDEI